MYLKIESKVSEWFGLSVGWAQGDEGGSGIDSADGILQRKGEGLVVSWISLLDVSCIVQRLDREC